MKRVILTIVIAVFLTIALTSSAFAVGDKVHEDNAEGQVYQNLETGLTDWGNRSGLLFID